MVWNLALIPYDICMVLIAKTMLERIGWLSYLKTIISLIVLFYLAVLVIYYKQEIKLLISRNLFGRNSKKMKNNTEASKDSGK